jgi:hypothetical protein
MSHKKLVWVFFLAACASAESGSQDMHQDAIGSTSDGAVALQSEGCEGAVSTCIGWNVRSYCVPTESGAMTATETCPAGCYQGACSTTSCSDECLLGATSSAGTCKLWDMTAGAFVPANPVGSLHDRARDYDKTLRTIDMPENAVMNANFTDTSYSQVQLYSGTGDAAIWTGTALAAQAWRLLATGEPDAAQEVATIAAELHHLLTVSGDPGYLARLAVPSSSTTPLEYASRCTDPEWHCNVPVAGTNYDWLGHTSRDQYTGVMLGYYLAYLASANNEPLRQMIRSDVLAIVSQLMTTQTVHATINVTNFPLIGGLVGPVGFKKTLQLANVILAPSEMTGGQVVITVDYNNPGSAGIAGMRDFLPDFGVAVQQMLGINYPVPRPSTAMMIGAYFQMALLMTDGVPGMSAAHGQILAYYQANAQSWLATAKGWQFSANCGNGYFANHIAYIMAFTWAALESDPALKPIIQGDVLNDGLWAALKGHKNSYFAFLWGATQAAPDPTAIADAVTQFSGFPPGPRIDAPTSLLSDPRYVPHDSSCANLCDTATLAVDVKDRRVDDFIWQRQPWILSDPGNPKLVYPGVDYLAAYWAGRYYKFLSEDRPGTCTRLAP